MEGTLTAWPFSKITIWSSTPGPRTPKPWTVVPWICFCSMPCLQVENGYYHIPVVPISCLKGQYCGMQCPVLGESIDVLSSKAAYKTSSRIRKSSHQGSSFLVGLRLVSLCPKANICGIWKHIILVFVLLDSNIGLWTLQWIIFQW